MMWRVASLSLIKAYINASPQIENDCQASEGQICDHKNNFPNKKERQHSHYSGKY
jgi:hypothetical protein